MTYVDTNVEDASISKKVKIYFLTPKNNNILQKTLLLQGINQIFNE